MEATTLAYIGYGTTLAMFIYSIFIQWSKASKSRVRALEEKLIACEKKMSDNIESRLAEIERRNK